MSTSIADTLMERRAALITQAQELAQKGVAEGRDLSADEAQKFDGMIAEAESLGKRAAEIAEGEKRGRELEESFRQNTGREMENRDQGDSAFGKWMREARVGDAFDIAPVHGAERRALKAITEKRAMSASGGIGADGVYGSLWEYAIAASQLLQAGVQIINTSDGNTLPFPVATVHATGATAAANAPLTASDPTITTVNNTVVKDQWITYVPSELLQDATFDLEGYLARAAGRELARRVAARATTAYIAGFTVSGAVGPASAAGTLGPQNDVGAGSDVLVDLFHSVLPEYRSSAAWTMADPTAALIDPRRRPGEGRALGHDPRRRGR